ncbi:dehydrogenase [Lithospermum erythrorhizon]|uniref:FAD-dependent oxidoreductase domain-containing protein 1 n=1 Tax=Lithospermum erythrorhizon TaxID=34254 RepID=A0AAV3NRM9_LITER
MAKVSTSKTFDVVIVGAGIIGLSVARQFLLGSNVSIAIIDSAEPCAGATGAGQGYIWRIHKDPESEKWALALRSQRLWEMLVESVMQQGKDPLIALGWKKTGSLLVGRTSEESDMLKKRLEKLSEAGVEALLLSNNELLLKESALGLGHEGSAAFLPDDFQIDARGTATFIQQFQAEGRYEEFFNEPVTNLIRSSSGEVEAVQTSKSIISCRKAVVVAAGCWSGSLTHNLVKNCNIELDLPIKPRKGHLLVIKNFKGFVLNHGLMELGYINHQSASTDQTLATDPQDISVSMAATMDMSGNLLLGSSRQFAGFQNEIDESIVNRMWERALEFFPLLRCHSLQDLRKDCEVRVGLRPYMASGKPAIGPVSGLPKLFLACGHEGEGLSLVSQPTNPIIFSIYSFMGSFITSLGTTLGTAEMIGDMVLEIH